MAGANYEFYEERYKNNTSDTERKHDGAYQAWLEFKKFHKNLTAVVVFKGAGEITQNRCGLTQQKADFFCTDLRIMLTYAIWQRDMEKNQPASSSSPKNQPS